MPQTLQGYTIYYYTLFATKFETDNQVVHKENSVINMRSKQTLIIVSAFPFSRFQGQRTVPGPRIDFHMTHHNF